MPNADRIQTEYRQNTDRTLAENMQSPRQSAEKNTMPNVRPSLHWFDRFIPMRHCRKIRLAVLLVAKQTRITGEDMPDFETLYAEVKQQLTEDHLKELARTVLDDYKAKNIVKLRMYADALFQKETHAGVPLNKIFVKLIKKIHPDRYTAHVRTVENAFTQKDREILSFYKAMLMIDTTAKQSFDKRFEYDFSEEYRYGEEDFGFDITDHDRQDEENIESFRSVDFDFVLALKAEYLGNLRYTLSPADLFAFEGELNLAGYGLEDTDGLQYCVNITRLDLSHNSISNLYDIQSLIYLNELLLSHNHIEQIEYLGGLENLEILDLSYNDIDDIGPLLSLEQLQFVDLRGNHLRTGGALSELKRRGVVVLY